MRMRMVPVSTMCRKHLMGEHVEMHMFVGTLKMKKAIDGYLKNNLLEPLSIEKRHKELAEEIEKRGYHHLSELKCSKEDVEYLGEKIFHKVDAFLARKDLHSRCPQCLAGFSLLN